MTSISYFNIFIPAPKRGGPGGTETNTCVLLPKTNRNAERPATLDNVIKIDSHMAYTNILAQATILLIDLNQKKKPTYFFQKQKYPLVFLGM